MREQLSQALTKLDFKEKALKATDAILAARRSRVLQQVDTRGSSFLRDAHKAAFVLDPRNRAAAAADESLVECELQIQIFGRVVLGKAEGVRVGRVVLRGRPGQATTGGAAIGMLPGRYQ